MAEYVKVDDLNLGGFTTWDGYSMTKDEVKEMLLVGVPTVELSEERREIARGDFGISIPVPIRRRLVGPWEKVDDE